MSALDLPIQQEEKEVYVSQDKMQAKTCYPVKSLRWERIVCKPRVFGSGVPVR